MLNVDLPLHLRHQARARRQAHAPGGRGDQRPRARDCRPSPTSALRGRDRRAAPAAGRRRASVDDLLPEAFAAVPRSGAAHRPHAPLRRAAHGRHGAARGQDRGDGDRRGQDPGGHAARLSRTRSPGSARTSSPSTTTWPAATRSGWGRSTTPSASPSGVIQHEMQYLLRPGVRLARHPARRAPAVHAAARPTTPTSPTARTTSSASTTSATTCASASTRWSSASTTTRSSTRSTRS